MNKLCPFLFSAVVDTRALPAFCTKEIVEKKCNCLEGLCAWYNEEVFACSVTINQSLMAAMATVELQATQNRIEQLKEKLSDTCIGHVTHL